MTSLYDPSRESVGKIYRDLQLMGDKTPVEVGDMVNAQLKDWVIDVNEALTAKRENDNPFYLTIHEKKDLQMPSAILRRLIYTEYRPWPEDDTIVYWKNPKTQELRFCWCLPHWSEMANMLNNPLIYDKDLLIDIKAWKDFNMPHFGFMYHKELRWIPNPKHKDKLVTQ